MPEQPTSTKQGPSRALLWFAFLGPPIAWLVHIGARYPLVPIACAHDLPVVLHVVTVGTLTVAIGAGVAAVSLSRRARASSSSTRGSVPDRVRYMAGVGLVLAMLFSLVIVAELVPALMQDPCLDVRQ